MDALHWAEFGAIALLTVAVLTLTYSLRQLERRASDSETRTAAVVEETRRAHLRLDNQERQIKALAKELGWTDDRAFTKVLTERLPTPGGER